jgi:mRNA interferase MazF
MVLQQGDVVWVAFPLPRSAEPAGRRPAIILSHNRFNATALQTVIVASITSKLKYESQPGNVRLHKGEAGLPRPSVVNVTQMAAVDKARIEGRIGTVSRARLQEIWEGVKLVLEPDLLLAV